MKNDNFAESLIKQSKLKYTNFKEKLQEILTGENPRKKEEELKQKEEEKIQKRIKDIENERKIDYILNKIPSLSDDTFKPEDILNDAPELKLEDLNSNKEKDNIKSNEPFSIDKYLQTEDNNPLPSKKEEKPIRPITLTKDRIIEAKVKKENSKENDDEIIIIQKKPLNIIKTEIKVDQITQELIAQSEAEKKKREIERKQNESLLLKYQKEKEISKKLSSIISNNISVSQNTNFSKTAKNKESFYSISSKYDKLEQARKILEEKLTPNERKQIEELKQKISQSKAELNNIIKEKKELEENIDNMRVELKNIKKEQKAYLEEYERKSNTEIRSIINQFKLQLYKQDLKPIAMPYVKEEVEKEKKRLQTQINNLNKQMKDSNIKHNKESARIQNEIKRINLENSVIQAKIKSYEEDRIWKNMLSNNAKNKENSLINDINKLSKMKSIPKQTIENDEIKIKQRLISTKTHLDELDLIYPSKYSLSKKETVTKQNFQQDGTIVREYDTGRKEILFSSGQKKNIYPDGYTLINYINGDIKQIIPNYKETYYYYKDKTLQVKFNDGSTYLKYEDGRVDVITR